MRRYVETLARMLAEVGHATIFILGPGAEFESLECNTDRCWTVGHTPMALLIRQVRQVKKISQGRWAPLQMDIMECIINHYHTMQRTKTLLGDPGLTTRNKDATRTKHNYTINVTTSIPCMCSRFFELPPRSLEIPRSEFARFTQQGLTSSYTDLRSKPVCVPCHDFSLDRISRIGPLMRTGCANGDQCLFCHLKHAKRPAPDRVAGCQPAGSSQCRFGIFSFDLLFCLSCWTRIRGFTNSFSGKYLDLFSYCCNYALQHASQRWACLENSHCNGNSSLPDA